MELYWLILTAFLVGGLVTALLTMFCQFSGLLRIHPNEEEGKPPYLLLELNDRPDKITKMKYVVFRVKLDSRQ